MTSVDLPAGFAPLPHALALTHPAPHVRLWSVLHYLGWSRTTFEASDLAAMLDTTERSIYRWLDAMNEDSWLSYDRQPGSRKRRLGERITLYSFEDREARTSDIRIRGCEQPLTSGSEVRTTSDIRIRGCEQPLTSGSQTSDPDVRGSSDMARPNAAKNATQIRTQTPDSDPTTTPLPPETPTPSAGGGGGSAAPPETRAPADHDTVRLLRELKVSPAVRQELAGVPADVARRTIAACRKVPNARDVAALAVAHLRAYLETGEELAPASPAPQCPDPPPLPTQPPLSRDEMRRIVQAARPGGTRGDPHAP